MRRILPGKLAAVLLLGLAASVSVAGEEEGTPPARGSWWGSWWGGKSRPEEKKVEEKPAPRTPGREQAVKEQEQQWNAFFRRQAACDRLREVAIITNNQELEREADRLYEQAWEVYRQRTAHLTGASTLEADEAMLDRRLGPQRSAARAPLPGRPARPDTRQASTGREVEQ